MAPKHYKIYPHKLIPMNYMVEIYFSPDNLMGFESKQAHLSELSGMIREFEQLGYIADSIEFN